MKKLWCWLFGHEYERVPVDEHGMFYFQCGICDKIKVK